MAQPGYIEKIITKEWKAKVSASHKLLAKTEYGKKLAQASSLRMKRNNPMSIPGMPMRISQIHKERGNGFGENRGGNGKLTVPQRMLWEVLGVGWKTELGIKTRKKTPYPTVYKVDIGNQELKIAIEVDGTGHNGRTQKRRDLKKSTLLAELGWSTYRFKNETILRLSSTWKLLDAHTILQMAYSSTIANHLLP